MTYDVFISHAFEDKDSVAVPLARQLEKLGLKVWLDQSELKLGDNLRRKIEAGLSESRFGIVILSPNFFKKEWTKRELDGLVAKDNGTRKVILPIWHRISKQKITMLSPILANTFAISTRSGIPHVAQEIFRVVRANIYAGTHASRRTIHHNIEATWIYDAFLSSPIGGFASGQRYSTNRRFVLELIEVLKERCKLKKIFFYGLKIESYKDLVIPNIWSIGDAFEAIEQSKRFILIYPARILSSVLVEAGYALASGIPSFYFVRNRDDLPHHLRAASEVFDFVKIYQFKDKKSLLESVEKHGMKMFELKNGVR